MCAEGLNPLKVDSVAARLRCPPQMEHRRVEFATMVVDAYSIVRRFAVDHQYGAHLEPSLFGSVEIFATEEKLIQRLSSVTTLPCRRPEGEVLCAALVSAVLMAVTPEEYASLRPEYASIDRAWTRLLAHEMAHELHSRVAGGQESMGPRWFYEGFAMYVAGQFFHEKVSTAEEAGAAIAATSRGSYAKYVAAFRFFVERLGIKQLLAHAHRKGFEEWLFASLK